mgnify:CR=1 FL=1
MPFRLQSICWRHEGKSRSSPPSEERRVRQGAYFFFTGRPAWLASPMLLTNS